MATPSTLPNFFEKYRTASRRHHQRFYQAPPHSLTALFRGALFVACATPLQRQLFYQSAPRTVRIQQFTLRQPPVSCILCPASCVRLYTLCVTIVSAMPSNHCTALSLYCPIVSPMYLLHLFSYYYSPIYCRKVIPNPARMFHALPCASCVLRPALRPTMRFVPCVRIDIALYLLCRAMPLCLLCAFSCILLYHATLRFYNFGLSCRTVIPSTTPRLFRRYSLEYNRTKVP